MLFKKSIAALMAAALLAPRAAAAYAETPDPAVAARPGPVATLPFRTVDGKVVIDAMIDGHGPYGLEIDSGAETLMIARSVADALKTTTATGTVELSGTTGGYVPVAQASIARVQFGAAMVERPFTTVAPASIPVDGYIGAPLFNTYTVEVDPGASVVALFKPDGDGAYRSDPADIAIPVVLGLHRVPLVQGAVGGVPAMLEIDSGSALPAELMPSFVKARDMTASAARVGSVTTVSVHGPVTSDVYAVAGISIGPDAAAGVSGKVPVVFLNASSPAPADAGYDGRIGSPILKSFVITYDYAHSRIYVRPIKSPAHPAAPSETAPAPTGSVVGAGSASSASAAP